FDKYTTHRTTDIRHLTSCPLPIFSQLYRAPFYSSLPDAGSPGRPSPTVGSPVPKSPCRVWRRCDSRSLRRQSHTSKLYCRFCSLLNSSTTTPSNGATDALSPMTSSVTP